MKNPASDYSSILKKYWGYDDFRGIQRDIIESIGHGKDTLGLMPTGGGKSITFQVPALAKEGVCIVITPLIALMKDQVHHLHQLGIRAAALYSGQSHDEMLRILENCIFGGIRLLYISPERLSSSLFQTKLRHMSVSFITVDEAHCISQWGYDFRPSYLEIAHIRTLLPDVPVLALTATATPAVVDDIQNQLHFREKCVFRMSFERRNLAYIVSNTPDKYSELLRLFRLYEGSAIVYVRSRRHAREVAEHLSDSGFSTTFYHAGLDHAQKDQRQQEWQHDRIRIMVATNAFGMGIDKPDVRLVVHYDCPDSIEAYFQEAGRAGRDGQPAKAILLYNKGDQAKLDKRIADTYPEKDYVRLVYEHLAYYYQIATGDGYGVAREFNIDEFSHRFHHFPIRVHSALQLLRRAGYIDYDEEADSRSRVRFLVGREDLYRLDQVSDVEERVIVALLRNYGGLFADYGFIDESVVAQQAGLSRTQTYEMLKQLSQRHLIHFIPRRNVPIIRYLQRREDPEHITLPPAVYEERRNQYQERIRSMLHYCQTADKCRSRQLLAYFGEHTKNDCGQCDVCLEGTHGGDDVRQHILQLLADGQLHPISQLSLLPFPTADINTVLAELISEDYIRQQDGLIMFHKTFMG